MWNNGTLYPIPHAAKYVDDSVCAVVPAGSTWARSPVPRIHTDTLGMAFVGKCVPPQKIGGTFKDDCQMFPTPCPEIEHATPANKMMGDWCKPPALSLSARNVRSLTGVSRAQMGAATVPTPARRSTETLVRSLIRQCVGLLLPLSRSLACVRARRRGRVLRRLDIGDDQRQACRPEGYQARQLCAVLALVSLCGLLLSGLLIVRACSILRLSRARAGSSNRRRERAQGLRGDGAGLAELRGREHRGLSRRRQPSCPVCPCVCKSMISRDACL